MAPRSLLGSCTTACMACHLHRAWLGCNLSCLNLRAALLVPNPCLVSGQPVAPCIHGVAPCPSGAGKSSACTLQLTALSTQTSCGQRGAEKAVCLFAAWDVTFFQSRGIDVLHLHLLYFCSASPWIDRLRTDGLSAQSGANRLLELSGFCA